MLLRRDVSQTELIICVVVWTSSVLYGIYCFAISADKLFQNYVDTYADFDQGWSFLSRKKDVGGYEWQMMTFLMKKSYGWMICSIITSEALRQLKIFKILPLWQILFGAIFVLIELGIPALALIMLQPLVYSVVLIARNKAAIWSTTAVVLPTLIICKEYAADDEYIAMLGLNHQTTYLVIISVYWMNLRCVSYCIDCIDSKLEHSNIKFLSYCFYMPQLICGPFIPYGDFQKSHQVAEDLLGRSIKLLMNIVRFLLWFAFLELTLHFVYVHAIMFHLEWIKSLDSWSLFGYGYTMGQFFHVKYVVTYGLSTTFASFENIQVPSLPICIGRVHLYSDMWKYFDAGLYNFLLRYIYIPIMTSFLSIRVLASLITFIFIYVWHGTENYILIWAMLNYCCIVIEYFSKWFYDKYIQDSRLYGIIGPTWFRKITCIAASPLVCMSIMSNFYFFASTEVGNIFMSRFGDDPYLTLLLWAIIYTLCQISTELRSRGNKSKQKVT